MKLDISRDFESVCSDFHVSATLRLSGADVALDSCVLNKPYEFTELEPTGGRVQRHGTLFVWSKSKSSKPDIGDIIIDTDGTYWTIWKFTQKHHVSVFRAVCLNLNIVTADENVATVLKASMGKGDANEAVATWIGYYSDVEGGNPSDNVKARFQATSEASVLDYGADAVEEMYRVYFNPTKPPELAGGEFRLIDPDGYRYRVLQYHKEQRIAQMPVAICQRITQGSEYWDR